MNTKGPYNDELIRAYRAELEVALVEISGQSWHQIISMHEMSIFTPEAAEEMITTIKRRKSLGMVASAVVFNKIIGGPMIKAQMTKIYELADIRFGFFESIDSAEIWLFTVS